ncbi:Trp biosynthesis-associated membrane protein, partial [Streptomyces sp. NPDC002690]
MEGVSAVPVPQPRARTTASDAPGSRRSLALGLLLGALGSAVVLLASGQTWARGEAAVAGGSLPLTAAGQDVTGAPAALAIVGLARPHPGGRADGQVRGEADV